MSIKELILNQLIDKYEKSRAYTEETNRRILVKMSEIKEYNIENYEQRELWHSIIMDLKKRNLIEFSWERFQESHILENVWLVKENVAEAYKEIKRQNPKESYKVILKQINGITFSQKWIQDFIEEMKEYMQKKQKENMLLPLEKSGDILKALCEIENITERDKNATMLKRVFSIKCYKDSKYFEKNIEKNIIRIVKKYKQLEELKEEEILAEIGIVRYPEIIEFCGDIECRIKGKRLEYSSVTQGSYMNGNTILSIESLKISDKVTQVIFIENKANYIDYIMNKNENELVIYHGGFYSPIKGEFFGKIYDSTKDKKIKYLHWGDIDIGGFEMFVRLRDNKIKELEPVKMNKESLIKYQENAKIFDGEYRKKLIKLRQNEKYHVFFDTIDFMLEKNIKMEQEVMI